MTPDVERSWKCGSVAITRWTQILQKLPSNYYDRENGTFKNVNKCLKYPFKIIYIYNLMIINNILKGKDLYGTQRNCIIHKEIVLLYVL